MNSRMQGAGNLKLKGYTLIEMLISVTIFSGLLIIVLGVVATSSSSSAKVSVLREKSQATRTLVDQISNDLRYVDTKAEFKDGNSNFFGYLVEPNRLLLALHLPNTDQDTELVRKEYKIDRVGNRLTLTLSEGRKCQILPSLAFSCEQNSTAGTDLLSSAYVLNQEATTFPSEFGGVTVEVAQNEQPPISPFVTISFTVRPSEFTSACSGLDSGSCYKVSTTVNVGTF